MLRHVSLLLRPRTTLSKVFIHICFNMTVYLVFRQLRQPTLIYSEELFQNIILVHKKGSSQTVKLNEDYSNSTINVTVTYSVGPEIQIKLCPPI